MSCDGTSMISPSVKASSSSLSGSKAYSALILYSEARVMVFVGFWCFLNTNLEIKMIVYVFLVSYFF